MLAALQGQLHLVFALLAFHTEHDLLGGLGLLLEDGLGLTSKTLLLSVVTTLSLGKDGSLSSLVLGNLVQGVLSALLGSTEGLAGLGNVNLITKKQRSNHSFIQSNNNQFIIKFESNIG